MKFATCKIPKFFVKNIMSYPNYQIIFLSTDEIVKKISIITNVNQFFSLRKLFSQSKFPNFCWQNNMSYPYYQILSLSIRWNCQKIVYHNTCKQIPIKNIVFAKLRYCPVHSIFTWNFHKEKNPPSAVKKPKVPLLIKCKAKAKCIEIIPLFSW